MQTLVELDSGVDLTVRDNPYLMLVPTPASLRSGSKRQKSIQIHLQLKDEVSYLYLLLQMGITMCKCVV